MLQFLYVFLISMVKGSRSWVFFFLLEFIEGADGLKLDYTLRKCTIVSGRT